MARKADGEMFVPEAEQLYKIPQNWRWAHIGAVADLYTGNSINEKVKKQKYEGNPEGYLYIATKDIGFDSVINYETNIRIPERDSFKVAPANTALLCVEGGSAGRKIGFVNQAVCFVNKLCAFRTSTVHSKYVFYFLQTHCFESQFLAKKHGLIGGVPIKALSTSIIPIAPLAEQQRIVDRIESLFTKLDAAREKAREVVDGFELRKAALLHRAFSGELTAQWRKNNGVSLDSWTRCKLIDILIEKPRNGYSPKPVDYPTPFKSMTLSATTSGVFMPEHYKYINETIPDDSYLWLQPGDILMQRANSIDKVGISALYTGKAHEFIYPDLMMKLQVKAGVSPEFVAYFLKSNETRLFLRRNAVGIAGNMPKINQKTVSNVPVFLPGFEEQKEIARILDHLFFAECYVKDTAQQVMKRIDTMKKALLGRAFRGELGTNDPSEASPDLSILGGAAE